MAVRETNIKNTMAATLMTGTSSQGTPTYKDYSIGTLGDVDTWDATKAMAIANALGVALGNSTSYGKRVATFRIMGS